MKFEKETMNKICTIPVQNIDVRLLPYVNPKAFMENHGYRKGKFNRKTRTSKRK